MPIYEYSCDACGHELEALQRIADAVLTECPSCEAPALRKKVSAAAFRLKGGGWYETDFKSGTKKNLANSDDKPAAKSGDSTTDTNKSASADPVKSKAGTNNKASTKTDTKSS